MTGAFEWIGKLAEWLAAWIPRWVVVPVTHAGVKSEGFFLPARWRRFDGDLRVTLLGPGLHWYWPATSDVWQFPVVFQTDNLPSQTIETADGVSIALGGMVSYTIEDAVALRTRCHSPVKAIAAICLPAIHRVACKMEWAALKDEQRKGTLVTKLRNEARKDLEPLGVRVTEIELTDMTRVRALRLIQSTQQDTE